MNKKKFLKKIIFFNYWGWGLGIGDWAQSPIPNPQSPIPNPHFILFINYKFKIIKKMKF